MIVFFSLTARYYYNFLFGPFALDRDAVVQLKDDNLSEYFVTVESDFCQDTGVPFMKTGKRGRKYVGGRYLLLDMKDSWLVVKVGNNAAAEKRWTGTIANLSPEARGDLAACWASTGSALGRAQLVARQLDATGSLATSAGARRASRPAQLVEPVRRVAVEQHQHPLAQRLKKYGEPAEVAEKTRSARLGGPHRNRQGDLRARGWCTHHVCVDSIFGHAVGYKSVTALSQRRADRKTARAICDIHAASGRTVEERQVHEFVMAGRSGCRGADWVRQDPRRDVEDNAGDLRDSEQRRRA